MDITPELVKKVAQNARLNLKEDEIKKFAAEMNDILANFQKLSHADTDGVTPSFHPIPVKNIARPDEPGACANREDALALAHHKTDQHFKGPKVL